MCNVKIVNTEGKEDCIIYNHILSKTEGDFTETSLQEEFRAYGIDLTIDEIKDQINSYIQSGLITKNIRSYSICR